MQSLVKSRCPRDNVVYWVGGGNGKEIRRLAPAVSHRETLLHLAYNKRAELSDL